MSRSWFPEWMKQVKQAFSRRPRRQKPKSRPGYRPRLEDLEARVVPTGAGDTIGDTTLNAYLVTSSYLLAGATYTVPNVAIDDVNDVDMYKVLLQQGQKMVVEVEARTVDSGQPLSNLDSMIRIFDAPDNNQLALDDDSADPQTNISSFDSALSFTAPYQGTYFIGVSGYPNSLYNPQVGGSGTASSSDGTGAYALEIQSPSPPSVVLGGPSGTVSDATNNYFSYSLSSNLYTSSASVTVTRNGTTISNTGDTPFPSTSSLSGTVDLNSSGLGTYQITATATDWAGQTTTQTQTQTVTDDDTTAPSISFSNAVNQSDSADNTVGWSISDASGIASRTVQLVRVSDSAVLFSNTSQDSASFNLNSLAPGQYRIQASATDADNDWTGDASSSSNSATFTIGDDDTAGPTVALGGSSGTASHGLTQQFTWNVTDSSGLSALSVVITQDTGSGPQTIYSSTSLANAVGSFNFDSYQLGTFALSVQATDADNDWSGDESSSSATRSVTVTNAAPTVPNPIPDQTFSGSGPKAFTFDTNTFSDADAGDTLSYSATLADGSALPAWLSFNAGTRTFSGNPGPLDITPLSIKVTATDPFAAAAADTFPLTLSNVNDAPAVSGEQTGQAVNDNSTVAPFSQLVVADAEHDSLTVTATITNGLLRGDFTSATAAGWSRSVSGTDIVYTRTFSSTTDAGAAATAGLQALVFAPRQNAIAPGLTETTNFRVQVQDSAGAAATSQPISTVTTSVNDSPVLQYDTLVFNIQDNQSVAPLQNVAVLDPDYQSMTATVTIRGGSVRGDFTAASATGWTRTTVNGTDFAYTRTFSGLNVGSLVTAALQSLVFQPRQNAILPGTSETTAIELSVFDGFASASLSSLYPMPGASGPAAQVTTTSVNDAPGLSGEQANQYFNYNATVAPLSTLVVADPDYQAMDVVVTVHTGGNAGDFTNTAGWQRSVNGTDITYARTFSGGDVGAQATAALQTLVFSRGNAAALTGTTEKTTFTVTVNDEIAAPVNNGAAEISVVATPIDAAPTTLPQNVTTAEDMGQGIVLQGSDAETPDGNLVFTITQMPAHGTLGVNGNALHVGSQLTGSPASVAYAPDADYNGPDSFQYTVTDTGSPADTLGNALTSSPATVSITVTEVNDAPTTGPVRVQLAEGTSAQVNVLAVATPGPANEAGQILHVISASALHGAVVINPDDTLTYTPNAYYNGPDTISYAIQDDGTTDGSPQPLTANGTVTVAVTPVADAPVAAPDQATVAEDGSANIDVLANDSDPDNLSGPANSGLTVLSVTQPAHGVVTVAADHLSVSYVPDANYNGPDAFNYTVTDPTGLTSTAQVLVTVTAVNDAPGAQSLNVTTAEDTPRSIQLQGSDLETAPAALVYTISTAPSHGTLTAVAGQNGLFLYTPDANYNGSDSFQYTVTDTGDPAGTPGNALTSSPATVSLTITAVNDAPAALPQTVSTAEDAATAVQMQGSDLETAPGALVFTITLLPAHGRLKDGQGNALGVGSTLTGSPALVTYTPDADYNGPDGFQYEVTDTGDPAGTPGNRLTSSPATVSLTVTAVNDAPTAQPVNATTAEDTAAAILLSGSDLETTAANLVLTVTQLPAHGSLSDGQGHPFTVGSQFVGSPASVIYTPAADYNGADSFQYTVTDGGDPTGTQANALTSAPATVSLTVTEVNDPPTANADAATVAENGSVNIPVLTNDVPGPANESTQALTVTQASALHGQVAINADNTLTYTPDANYNGPDTISYAIQDDGTTDGQPDPRTAGGTVSVTVTPVNSRPTASPVQATTAEDTAKVIQLLGGDVETPAAYLIFTITGGPSHGTLTPAVGPNGAFLYAPGPDYNGSDSFTYTVTDTGDPTGTQANALTSTPATVGLTVTEVNDPPVTSPASVSVAQGNSVTVNVLANAVPGPANESTQTLTVTQVSALHGTILINGDGTVIYTAPANYRGADLITYVVRDNGTTAGQPDAKAANGTVSVTVTPVNHAPAFDAVTVTSDVGWVTMRSALTVHVIAHDVDGDPISYSYQWLKNGQPIAGATGKTLDLGSVQARLRDVIAVTVTASDGTASSSTTVAAGTVGQSAYAAAALRFLTVSYYQAKAAWQALGTTDALLAFSNASYALYYANQAYYVDPNAWYWASYYTSFATLYSSMAFYEVPNAASASAYFSAYYGMWYALSATMQP